MKVALKGGAALLHGLAGDCQGVVPLGAIRIVRRIMPPDLGLDLVSGNLAGGAHGGIIVTRLKLRESAPTVHGLKPKAHRENYSNHDDAELHFHPGKHCWATGSRSRASASGRSDCTPLPCP
jgi:hypothetical protein